MAQPFQDGSVSSWLEHGWASTCAGKSPKLCLSVFLVSVCSVTVPEMKKRKDATWKICP